MGKMLVKAPPPLECARHVFRAIERSGGLSTFERLKRDLGPGYPATPIRQAISDLEETGRVTVLLGPKQTVYYASDACLEEAR